VAIALPPSLRKERHSVAAEVSWAKQLTPPERLAVVALLCRDAVTLLQMNPKADQVLAMRDPVPESTKRALARLRREARS
jgi:hypothetical protein